MALIDEFIGRQAHSERARSFSTEVFHIIGLALSALAAGWRASLDYEQLNRRSDRQLHEVGLSRDQLPKAIHERHFAKLGRSTNS